MDSLVVRHFEGDDQTHDDVVAAVDRIMRHADDNRRLGVRANADTPDDAGRSRRFGGQGIGLCRTEHMFLGERRELVEHLILAETPEAQERALGDLLPLQRHDFVGILEAMDGLPVTIRLIDPPLHEFLPDYTELAMQVALEDGSARDNRRDAKLLEAVKRLHEYNPMLGLRGVRLGIVIPGLFRMQARAILEAAAERIKAGGDPQPEIMVPLVGAVQELQLVKADIMLVAAEVQEAAGIDIPFKVGTMIELPRAAVTGRDRRGRGVLLLLFQRPDPDDVGLLARRRRGRLLLRLPGEGRVRGQPVRDPRHRGRGLSGPGGLRAGTRDPAGPPPRSVRRARR